MGKNKKKKSKGENGGGGGGGNAAAAAPAAAGAGSSSSGGGAKAAGGKPLKALILVGGYGTRLRPLTFSVAKPLVPFCNKPIVLHQIEALVKVGVKEIILAVNYKPEDLRVFLSDCEKRLGVSITFSLEDEPLGTAGPLALARKHLENCNFFMMNSDVICTFPLDKMLDFHLDHGREGSILVTPVEDPSKYGVVVADPKSGMIQTFVEKPQVFVGRNINAGIYLFDSRILNRVELKPTSIEREIFPRMAADSELYSMVLPGYWMDIGQPKDYLRGLCLHLETVHDANHGGGAEEKKKERGASKGDHTDANGVTYRGRVLVHPSAKIGRGALLGPNVTIDKDVVVGEGARIERAAVLEGAQIRPHAFVRSSIIGWKSVVGSWSRVDECIVGEDVKFNEGISAKTVTVCPHKGVKADIKDTIVL